MEPKFQSYAIIDFPLLLDMYSSLNDWETNQEIIIVNNKSELVKVYFCSDKEIIANRPIDFTLNFSAQEKHLSMWN